MRGIQLPAREPDLKIRPPPAEDFRSRSHVGHVYNRESDVTESLWCGYCTTFPVRRLHVQVSHASVNILLLTPFWVQDDINSIICYKSSAVILHIRRTSNLYESKKINEYKYDRLAQRAALANIIGTERQ